MGQKRIQPFQPNNFVLEISGNLKELSLLFKIRIISKRHKMKQNEEFKMSLFGLKIETKNPRWPSIIIIVITLVFFSIALFFTR
jgi:hypothetical protein